MTFETFDTVLLVPCESFPATLLGAGTMPEGDAPGAGTLEAALRQAGEAGRGAELPAPGADDVPGRRAARAEALVLDFVDRAERR